MLAVVSKNRPHLDNSFKWSNTIFHWNIAFVAMPKKIVFKWNHGTPHKNILLNSILIIMKLVLNTMKHKFKTNLTSIQIILLCTWKLHSFSGSFSKHSLQNSNYRRNVFYNVYNITQFFCLSCGCNTRLWLKYGERAKGAIIDEARGSQDERERPAVRWQYNPVPVSLWELASSCGESYFSYIISDSSVCDHMYYHNVNIVECFENEISMSF